MLSKVVSGQKPSLKIVPYQGILHFRPQLKYEHLDPTIQHRPDETFWGTVILSLPKPRPFTSLTVKLVAPYVLHMPGHHPETGTLFESNCSIDIPPTLEKGEHSFSWALNVPRNGAPYERSDYGTVNHKLVAIAQGPLGTITEELPVEVVVNPSAEGETSVINERIEGFNDETGPYLITLASPHLTIGGPLHFTLTLASAPATGLVVHNVTGSISQSFMLTSPKDKSKISRPSSQDRVLFRIDGGTPLRWPGEPDPAYKSGHLPLPVVSIEHSAVVAGPESRSSSPGGVSPSPSFGRAQNRSKSRDRRKQMQLGRDCDHAMSIVASGEKFQLSHIARMPVDERLRPSTHEGTDSPFRVEHSVIISVTFSVPHRSGQRMLRMERPLHVLSCGCLPGSLVLPSYDDATETIKQQKVWRSKDGCGDFIACMCMYKIGSLLTTKHFSPLLDAHEAFAHPGTPSDEVFRANKRDSTLPRFVPG